MINFGQIYIQSIALFDDPEISSAYDNNVIEFDKLMYPFLNASVSLFTQPFRIGEVLCDFSEPEGKMEIFEADGITNTFSLSFIPLENSVFQFVEDGVIVDGTYDAENNSVTFPNVLEKNKEYSFESYFEGCFNSDFNITGKKTLDTIIQNQVISILARMLVRAWGENNRNFLLDIQNVLRDGEFSLHPASAALNAKDKWIKHLEEEIYQLQNKLSHNLRFASNSNWVRRFN